MLGNEQSRTDSPVTKLANEREIEPRRNFGTARWPYSRRTTRTRGGSVILNKLAVRSSAERDDGDTEIQ